MNKKIAVIYKSKYGSTKCYAGWIALKLDADLYEVEDIRPKDLEDYDTIIYGGGIYASKISGINFINKNINRIKDKEVIVFGVGMELESSNFEEIKSKSLNEEMADKIKVYKFRGSFSYKKLSIIDKLLMKGLKYIINKKSVRDLSEDEKVVLEGFEKDINLCNKKSIEELINSIGTSNSSL